MSIFSFAKSASSGSIPPVLAEEPTIRFSNINLIFNLNLIFKINLNINIIFKINLNINFTFDFDFSFRICLDSTKMFLQVIISPHALQSLISTLLPRPVQVSSVYMHNVPLNSWKYLKKNLFQVRNVCCTWVAEIPPTTQVHKFGKSRSVLIVYLDLLVTQLLNIFTKFVSRCCADIQFWVLLTNKDKTKQDPG